jgi:hypothetical protein
VNEASALAATASTAAVMEAAEKVVAVKVGWLECSMPPTRATGGRKAVPRAFIEWLSRRSWLPPLGTSKEASERHQ